jgi:hypothetical protein
MTGSVEAAAARAARPAAATAVMMMSAPVRAMRYGVMSVAPMQNMRPRVTRPTPYAVSMTIVSVMMVGPMMIATMTEQCSKEAAKLGERGRRLQNGGGGQSEQAKQQGTTRNARSAFPVDGPASTFLKPLLVHRVGSPST